MGDQEELEPQLFTLEAKVDVQFDADDIAKNLTPVQCAQLVIQLDDEVGSWEHTLLLYHHFKEQYDIALKEEPELAQMSVEELRGQMERDEEQEGRV